MVRQGSARDAVGLAGAGIPGPRKGPEPSLVDWISARRPAAPPGVYRLDYRPPRSGLDPEALETPENGAAALTTRALIARLVLSILVAYPVMYVLGWVWGVVARDVVRIAGSNTAARFVMNLTYVPAVAFILALIGCWPELWRRWLAPALARLVTDGAIEEESRQPSDAIGQPSRGPFADLHAAGPRGAAAAHVLDQAVADRSLLDADYVRLRRAQRWAGDDAARQLAVATTIAKRGAAAFCHPSGQRDLPRRTTSHDLLSGQVRLGRVADDPGNPIALRGVGSAVSPSVLATSMLSVGASGASAAALRRRIAESLSLQALCGGAVVVAVGDASADLGPDDQYDVVVRLGSGPSDYHLDLYAGASEDLAELLLDAVSPAGASPPPVGAVPYVEAVLGQFLDARGRLPGAAELATLMREDQWGATAPGRVSVDASVRATLAERFAVLGRAPLRDRTGVRGAGDAHGRPRLYSVGAVEQPLRVRVETPGGARSEAASRVITRLITAQFVRAVLNRRDRSLFACLLLAEADHVLDGLFVRRLAALREANAGVVLGARSLAALTDRERDDLVSSVGCLAAVPGISVTDARVLQGAWGTVSRRESVVSSTADDSGGMLRRGVRGGWSLVTGMPARRQSVTTTHAERPRWPATVLSRQLRPTEVVLSATSVDGRIGPPLRVDLASHGA